MCHTLEKLEVDFSWLISPSGAFEAKRNNVDAKLEVMPVSKAKFLPEARVYVCRRQVALAIEVLFSLIYLSIMTNMKPEEDAFGQMVWAQHSGIESFEVMERDDGYIDVGDPKIYFSEWKDWAPFEQRSMYFPKGRVLDIGCGAGRHALYLQEKSFDVLGIDISPLAIKVCKLRGLKKTRVMAVDEVNFKPNSYDTILMMGNNFGLFANFGKARRLLKRFYRMTSKNAIIIACTNDIYKTDNPAHLLYQKLNRERGRMGGQIRMRFRFKEYTSKWFDYLMVSKEELEEILRGTGWKTKEFIDSVDSFYIGIIEKESK